MKKLLVFLKYRLVYLKVSGSLFIIILHFFFDKLFFADYYSYIEQERMSDFESISIKEKVLIVFPVLQSVPIMGLRRFRKIGTYKVKPGKFFEQLLKKDKEMEIAIQQFICPYCRSSVYPPEKKRKMILF